MHLESLVLLLSGAGFPKSPGGRGSPGGPLGYLSGVTAVPHGSFCSVQDRQSPRPSRGTVLPDPRSSPAVRLRSGER